MPDDVDTGRSDVLDTANVSRTTGTPRFSSSPPGGAKRLSRSPVLLLSPLPLRRSLSVQLPSSTAAESDDLEPRRPLSCDRSLLKELERRRLLLPAFLSPPSEADSSEALRERLARFNRWSR